jgi:hypothetical protein
MIQGHPEGVIDGIAFDPVLQGSEANAAISRAELLALGIQDQMFDYYNFPVETRVLPE